MKPDEKKHFWILYFLTAAIVIVFRLQLDPIGWRVWNMYNWDCMIAFGVGLVIAIGKEVIWDKVLGKGTPQPYDAFWGIVGSILGPGTVLLVEGIILLFIQ